MFVLLNFFLIKILLQRFQQLNLLLSMFIDSKFYSHTTHPYAMQNPFELVENRSSTIENLLMGLTQQLPAVKPTQKDIGGIGLALKKQGLQQVLF